MGEVTFWVLVAAGVMFALMAFIMVALVGITQLRQGRRIDAVLLHTADSDTTEAATVADTPTPTTSDIVVENTK
jgi:hypothetical protein